MREKTRILNRIRSAIKERKTRWDGYELTRIAISEEVYHLIWDDKDYLHVIGGSDIIYGIPIVLDGTIEDIMFSYEPINRKKRKK